MINFHTLKHVQNIVFHIDTYLEYRLFYWSLPMVHFIQLVPAQSTLCYTDPCPEYFLLYRSLYIVHYITDPCLELIILCWSLSNSILLMLVLSMFSYIISHFSLLLPHPPCPGFMLQRGCRGNLRIFSSVWWPWSWQSRRQGCGRSHQEQQWPRGGWHQRRFLIPDFGSGCGDEIHQFLQPLFTCIRFATKVGTAWLLP